MQQLNYDSNLMSRVDAFKIKGLNFDDGFWVTQIYNRILLWTFLFEYLNYNNMCF